MGKGDDVLRLTFGIMGNVAGLFLFLSPLVTFKRILAKRSTEQFSAMPYIMTLLNCLLATWYGLPFITRKNYLLSAINAVGVAIETAYLFIFIVFASKKDKVKISKLLACVIVIFSVVASVSLLAVHKEKERQFICGFTLTIFSIMMYASPLAVMRVVIRTRSVEFMPFLLSLFVFISATCWVIYGLIGKDIFIIVPNSLGSVLGAIQLTLYAVYCKNKGETNKPTADLSLENRVINDDAELQKLPNGP